MDYVTTPKTKQTIEALWRLEKIILDTLDFGDVVQKIVDSVLSELGYLKLGYRIVVLALVDEKGEVLERISISQTAEAKHALEVTPVPFHEIDIPMSAGDNVCVRAVLSNKPIVTRDWTEILCPPYLPEEARKVQEIVGIKTSMVYPVISRGQAIGVLIFSMVKDESEVSEAEKDLIRGFTDIVGLAVQNARLFTSLDEAKKELQKVNIKLQELDRLKDEFVSVASHELRTPMTAIKSYLWMALHKRRNELSPELAKYLDRAYISVERLIHLVGDMLNISRIDSGRIALNLGEVDLVDLARDVVFELGPKASEKVVEMTVGGAGDMPKALCDGDKIHEVLINLVGNSLKFTKPGGKITISFAAGENMITATVSDTGCGIAREDIGKLFSKFTMLANSYGEVPQSSGTGLGLYICKSIVNLHRGQIYAQSDGRGKGSKFTFTLPIAGTDLAAKLEETAPKETENTKDLEKTNVNVMR